MCLSFVTASVFGCAMIDSYTGDGFRPVDSAPAASIQGFQPRARRACPGALRQIDWQRSSMVRGTDAGLHAAGVCGRHDDPTDDAALHADRIDLQLLRVLPRPLTKKTSAICEASHIHERLQTIADTRTGKRNAAAPACRASMRTRKRS